MIRRRAVPWGSHGCEELVTLFS